MLTALLPLVSMAQKDDFNSLFRKMSGVEGYTAVEITKDMIKLLGSGNSKEQVKNSGDLDGVESIRMIVADKYSDKFAEEAKKCSAGFRLLTSVKSKSGEVSIYIKETSGSKNSRKSEMLVISLGEEDNAVLHINGTIDINKISALPGVKAIKN